MRFLRKKKREEVNVPKIIFQDGEVLVLDKPAGWITNEADTVTNQPVIQTWVKENGSWPLAKNKEFRSGVVHRLDKETSGVLLIAKTKDAFENLQKQFKERKVAKKYTALVHGMVVPGPPAGGGVIKAPVGRLPWRRDRFGVLPEGREAVTGYRVVGELFHGKEPLSLVELTPKTGRTHQIRIHLKYLGHPIVGDSFYAGRKTARNDRIWCPRLFLHASEISFNHPTSGERVSFKSKLPESLQSVLNK